MRPAAALAERLGLAVRDLELLQQALIHSSYLHEHRDLAVGHNERLEFLGDSVVSLAISNALYRRHPDDDEGVLSARRASIVSTAWLDWQVVFRSASTYRWERGNRSVAVGAGRLCLLPRLRLS